MLQVSIRRDRLEWQNITVRRRDDAGDALRSSPEHAGAFDKMVLAQGLGDADRQGNFMLLVRTFASFSLNFARMSSICSDLTVAGLPKSAAFEMISKRCWLAISRSMSFK